MRRWLPVGLLLALSVLLLMLAATFSSCSSQRQRYRAMAWEQAGSRSLEVDSGRLEFRTGRQALRLWSGRQEVLIVPEGPFRFGPDSGFNRGVLSPEETIFGLYTRNLFDAVRARFLLETSFFSYNPRSDLRATFQTGQLGQDYRWDGYMQLPRIANGAFRFVKLVDPFQVEGFEFQRPPHLVVGVNMIKLPEMYYIAAEALLDTDPVQARIYFDLVIESRGLIGLADRDPAQALNLDHITADRYKEFIGEGQTFFNMKRLHLDIVDVNMAVVPASNDVYVLPIPLEENDYRN